MLYFETIDRNTLELLRRIQSHSAFSGTRLVGGTALALQIGHRKSIDLDFFGRMDITPIEFRQTLEAFGEVSLRNASGRIRQFLVCGVQVDFVDYAYPWLDQEISFDGLRLAACSDIAAMKLSAITNRGTKKDFIDMAFLLERFSLSEMLDFYKRKFSDGASFPVLKSLVFFDDAEEDPLPNMLHAVDWDSAKQRISEAVEALSTVTW